MDYGQTKQSTPSDEALFDTGITTGVGTNSESINPDSAESLHSSDESISWDAQPSRSPQTISSLGNIAIQPSSEQPLTATSAELGKVVPLEMPPDYTADSSATAATQNTATPSDVTNLDSVRAENDRISPKTLEIAEHAVANFEKGKTTPADFQRQIWQAKKAYLKNSFGRELES